jgi:5-methylcytosine-specific restriction protein A
MDDLFEEVRQVVEARAQISLALSEEIVWSGPFAVLRPVDLKDQPSFAIALVPSRFDATASFVPDVFAGLLMRKMRENLVADFERWTNFVSDLQKRCKVNVLVDSRPAELADLNSLRWQRVEFDCSIPLHGSSGQTGRRDAFIEAASSCLSLVLLALDGENAEGSESKIEGAASQARVTKYERSPANRLRCIQYWGPNCWVCEFDFQKTYGVLGDGFIEVHHVQPLATYKSPMAVNPKTDLVPLCSNCHSMIHRDDVVSPMRPEELRILIGKTSRALSNE